MGMGKSNRQNSVHLRERLREKGAEYERSLNITRQGAKTAYKRHGVEAGVTSPLCDVIPVLGYDTRAKRHVFSWLIADV